MICYINLFFSLYTVCPCKILSLCLYEYYLYEYYLKGWNGVATHFQESSLTKNRENQSCCQLSHYKDHFFNLKLNSNTLNKSKHWNSLFMLFFFLFLSFLFLFLCVSCSTRFSLFFFLFVVSCFFLCSSSSWWIFWFNDNNIIKVIHLPLKEDTQDTVNIL